MPLKPRRRSAQQPWLQGSYNYNYSYALELLFLQTVSQKDTIPRGDACATLIFLYFISLLCFVSAFSLISALNSHLCL